MATILAARTVKAMTENSWPSSIIHRSRSCLVRGHAGKTRDRGLAALKQLLEQRPRAQRQMTRKI
jgi:hypothetical protein